MERAVNWMERILYDPLYHYFYKKACDKVRASGGAPENFNFQANMTWFVVKWAVIAPVISVIAFIAIIMAKRQLATANIFHISFSAEIIIVSFYLVIVMALYLVLIAKHIAKIDALSH